jgi:hypothetical protein
MFLFMLIVLIIIPPKLQVVANDLNCLGTFRFLYLAGLLSLVHLRILFRPEKNIQLLYLVRHPLVYYMKYNSKPTRLS